MQLLTHDVLDVNFQLLSEIKQHSMSIFTLGERKRAGFRRA